VQTKITNFIHTDVPRNTFEFLVKVLTLCKLIYMFETCEDAVNVFDKAVAKKILEYLKEYEDYIYENPYRASLKEFAVLYEFDEKYYILIDFIYPHKSYQPYVMNFTIGKNTLLAKRLKGFNNFFNIINNISFLETIERNYLNRNYIFGKCINHEYPLENRQYFEYIGFLPNEIIESILKSELTKVIFAPSGRVLNIDVLKENYSKIEEFCLKIFETFSTFFNKFMTFFNNVTNVDEFVENVEAAVRNVFQGVEISKVMVDNGNSVIKLKPRRLSDEIVRMLEDRLFEIFSLYTIYTIRFDEFSKTINFIFHENVFTLIYEKGLGNAVESFAKLLITYKLLNEFIK